MRHGRVNQSGKSWIKPRELRAHITGYNSAPIMPPPADLPPLCDTPFILCSMLRRSTDSAALRFGRHDHIDALFNEAGLPDIPLPPLPATVLMLLARISWFLGRDKGCESYAALKNRAQEAALALIKTSEDHKCVVLVGHGILNRSIAKYLLKAGYSGPKRPASKHWACTAYTPATERSDSKN